MQDHYVLKNAVIDLWPFGMGFSLALFLDGAFSFCGLVASAFAFLASGSADMFAMSDSKDLLLHFFLVFPLAFSLGFAWFFSSSFLFVSSVLSGGASSVSPASLASP